VTNKEKLSSTFVNSLDVNIEDALAIYFLQEPLKFREENLHSPFLLIVYVGSDGIHTFLLEKDGSMMKFLPTYADVAIRSRPRSHEH